MKICRLWAERSRKECQRQSILSELRLNPTDYTSEQTETDLDWSWDFTRIWTDLDRSLGLAVKCVCFWSEDSGGSSHLQAETCRTGSRTCECARGQDPGLCVDTCCCSESGRECSERRPNFQVQTQDYCG
uniref:Uncharacterized protein n=1 Tax=Knipowitschia caucasica TaxID=637954 RepID=A0AAV2MFB3_KNICA